MSAPTPIYFDWIQNTKLDEFLHVFSLIQMDIETHTFSFATTAGKLFWADVIRMSVGKNEALIKMSLA